MRFCLLCNKKNAPGSGVFFSVPKDERKRQKWAEICRMDVKAKSHICIDHFERKDIIATGRRFCLIPNAMPIVQQQEELTVPSYYMPVYNEELSCPMEDEYQPLETHLEELRFISMEEVTSTAALTTPERRFKDQDCQTYCTSFEIKLKGYKERIRQLESENRELRFELLKANAINENMKKIFTDGQIRHLLTPGNIKWKWIDISAAICLHASGPRAYHHLYKKGFPLPHVTTLQRWCQRVEINEGVLHTTIEFMKRTSDLSLHEKVCVLAFDEMKVEETFEYDQKGDVVRKPANYVQVVMARGLKKSWKQPVFYGFDTKMTSELLNSIIFKLHIAGFPVVAVVCDMGPTNHKLLRELGVTPDKPWFPSPVNKEEKVFSFLDAPHLLKLIRNHFLDTGLVYNNSILKKNTISDLLGFTSKSDVSITFKLSDEHLSVKGVGRQKVKLAAQLFSNSTANAILRCYSLGMDVYNAVETAAFFQLVNDWFDVLNAKMDTFNYPGKQPYGLLHETQKATLSRMTDVMSKPIIPGKKTVEHFQRGIMITNNALEMLHEYVCKYGMTYLVTNRLNQDVLEHFFGAIRSKGGLNDHPSPQEFKYRLRKYILARNTELLNGTGNTEIDETAWLNTTDVNMSFVEHSRVSAEVLSEEIFNEAGFEDDYLVDSGCQELNEESILENLDDLNLDDIGVLQEDALEYIAGYIIRKLHLVEYECNQDSYTWVDQVSKGFLKKPATHFVLKIKQLETLFYKVNGVNISHRQHLRRHLVMESKPVDLPENVKEFFYKCRIYFRIKNLNLRLKTQKDKQRRLGFKKLLKVQM